MARKSPDDYRRLESPVSSQVVFDYICPQAVCTPAFDTSPLLAFNILWVTLPLNILMGYTIKQKIEICLKLEAEPHMTQLDLANWAKEKYGSTKPIAQTTISRILSSKNEILGSKEADFLLVRRRKQTNPLLRKILTEWITQAHWERIPITTPIIQLTAYAIWSRLPTALKDGNGVFNHKWCNSFVKKLNINLIGSPQAIRENMGYKLNKEWKLDEKLELKKYIRWLISEKNYAPCDIFTIDEFSLFYLLPLDQIFDISSIDKGLKQSSSSTENMLTIMLGCNIDGSEKLNPLVVSKHESIDVSSSSHSGLQSQLTALLSPLAIINKIGQVYQITYKSNNNKWITSSMFQDYLLTLDHKLENSTPDRNIIILLDNSSSHRMINLEFKHIKLVYLENTSKHKNPFNGPNSAKFDYLPMSFGIVEQFKILYRLQQYLEMINKQRNNSDSDTLVLPKLGSSMLNLASMKADGSTEVLSEQDYQIPFIKVIEWIHRSWDSISTQLIFLSWKHTYLINFNAPWPASNPQVVQRAQATLGPLLEGLATYDSQKSYKKLQEIMKYLNVVIPWEIDDLLGLVNERSKVSLSYASIEEIIGSCVAGHTVDEDSTKDENPPLNSTIVPEPWLATDSPALSLPESKMSVQAPRISESPLEAKTPLNALLQLAPLSSLANQPKLRQYDQLPGQSLKFGNNNYGEYTAPSPGPMSMNALLMATNVSKNEDIQASGFGSLPARQDFLPPVLMNNLGSAELKSRLGPEPALPERKRPHFMNPMPPSYFAAQAPAGLAAGQIGDTASRTPSAYPNNLISESLSRFASERNSAQSPTITETLPNEAELIGVLSRIIDASNGDGLKLSSYAVEELKSNLSKIQHKYGPN